MSEALYRKYRPQIFEDVVGQEHIERTLKNAIASDKVSHAYLFTGPRGTGKTTTARLLSKALLCQSGPTPDPDGACEDCELIAAGEHPDVYELDAASRTGVENVREEIIGRVSYAPTRGRYKVYIIDEVHMLSTAAFNALLKTLEEPPSHVVFILCTTDPQKVPETIHSRCQRFDFRRISSEELISRLGAICEMEGITYEGDALDLIAHRAQGGMRDALTSLEQLIAFGEGEVTTEQAERLLGSLDSSDLAEIVQAIGMRDAAACFRWTAEYMETGADLAQFAQEFAEHMRDMYVMSLTDADVALEVTEAERREFEVELQWFGPDRLSRLLNVVGDLIADLKTSTNQRLSFEIALTRMLRPQSDLTMEALAERIESLERGFSSSMTLPTSSRTAAPVVAATAPLVQQEAPAAPSEAFSARQDAPSAASSPVSGLPQGEEAPGVEAMDGSEEGGPSAASSNPAKPSAEPAQAKPTPESVQGSAGAVDLSTINISALWNTVLAHLKKAAAAYGVLFMNASPALDPASGKLIILFDPANDFMFQAVQKPEVREALENALGRAGVLGLPYEILSGTPAGSGLVAVPTSQEPPSPPVSSGDGRPGEGSFAPGQLPPSRDVPQSSAPAEKVQSTPEPPLGDEVPLSAYEDLSDETASDAASQPWDAPSSAEGTGPSPSQDPSCSSGSPSTSDQQPPEAPVAAEEDLNDILLSTFGSDIKIEEV